MEREDFLDSVEEKDERLEALKQLYPEIFSDGKINLDAFKDATGTSDLPEDEDKTPGYYGLYWPGKRAAKQLAKKTASGTLEPVPGDGVNENNTHNIYIEGDNLEVLRILRNSYRGRVKMIYIDPPYNTGSDFIYPDDYSMPVDEYLKFTRQIDEKGNYLVANPKSSGAFHRKWLDMMYPRLSLAREFLSEDGVIFISIDDNEQANLKLLCDDIFGEENFITNIAVEMSKTQGMKVKVAQDGAIVKNHEYVLVYQKSSSDKKRTPLYDKTEPWDSHFNTVITKDDKNIKSYHLSNYIRDYHRDIYNKFEVFQLLNKGKIDSDAITKGIIIDEEIRNFFYGDFSNNIYQEMACSITIPETIEEQLKKGKIVEYEKYLLHMSSGGKLRQYRNLNENLHVSDEYNAELCRTTIRGALWKGFYSDMMNVAKEGNVEYKNGKKPIRLIKQLLKWANLSDDDIVLDFFGGSSSTGHAVLSYNEECNKNIRYMLVQLPVDISSKSEYRTICELGKHRLRNICKQYISRNLNIDIGFKVYRENESNFIKYKSIEGQNKEALNKVLTSLDSMIDPLVDGWKIENVLEEIKLRQGFALDCNVEEVKDVSSNKVWHLTDPERPITLYVCLDKKIEQKTVDSLNIGKDDKFICLNSAIDDTTYARLADKNRVQTL